MPKLVIFFLLLNEGDDMNKEKRIYLLALIPIILMIIIAILPKPSDNEVISNPVLNVSDSKKIKVYVSGEVKYRGAYVMYEGKTIYDLLKKCGLTDYSDTSSLDYSQELKDGYTYNISIVSNTSKEVSISVISGTISNVEPYTKKININTATKEELMELDKIGLERASAIIEYRKTQKFKSIDDIKKVNGISEVIFDAIKDYITV